MCCVVCGVFVEYGELGTHLVSFSISAIWCGVTVGPNLTANVNRQVSGRHMGSCGGHAPHNIV